MFYYYKNGNYLVKINDHDGTKERITMDDNMHPDFPENIDIEDRTIYRVDHNTGLLYLCE